MKFLIKLFFLCFAFNGAIFAQNIDSKDILGSNPDLQSILAEYPELLNMYENETNKKNDKSNKRKKAPTLNSEDLRTGDTGIDGIINQTNISEYKKPSVLQSYFKILTGLNLPIYGAVEFNQKQKDELLFFNTYQDSYQLAPGDVLRISRRGLDEIDEEVKVNSDSKLILKKLAPIDITGLSMSDLEIQLTDLIRIDDASAMVNVSLSLARLVTVQISGDVDSPRTLAIPAYTPLSRVIAYAGGISDTGSLRNIKVIHRNGVVENVDFYEFLQNPFNSNDPVLANNARVFISQKGPTVSISGFVARPGIYELPIDDVEIEYTKLIKMAGTTLLPPGVSIEALSFNENGILSSRKLKKGGLIYAGEGLHIGFIETANLNTISIKGAVHSEFTLATRQPIPVLTALKSGAVLKNNAVLNFAIIKTQGQPNTVINLSDALNDSNIKIPVGSTLFIYNQDEYSYLVSADKKNLDEMTLKNRQMIAELNNTALAEVYIDGKRIAYLPPNLNLNLKSYQTIISASVNTMHFDLAIISDLTGTIQTRAVNLNSNPNFTTNNNQIIKLFSKSFFMKIIGGYNSDNIFDDIRSVKESIRSVKESGAASVFVDGKLKNLIAPSGSLHTNKGFRILSDENNIYQLYAIHHKYDTSTALWSDKAYILNRFKDKSNSIKINYRDRFDLFTDDFIRNDLFAERDKDSIIINPSFRPGNRNTSKGVRADEGKLYTELDSEKFSNLISSSVSSKKVEMDLLKKYEEYSAANSLSSNSNVSSLEENNRLPNTEKKLLKIPNIGKMRQASRVILGSVYFPGRYPIAKQISLNLVINQAGGFTERANLNDIELATIENQNGNLVLINREKYTSEEIKLINTPLTNSFALRINSLINDADLGTITIDGEVNNPGKYSFSRGETIHDIIERAGGFTDVAYPIGSIFNREKIRLQQVENNEILANQIEKSMLNLSKVNIGDAGAQASAILGFAMRLKGLPASGRMSVNISLRDDYLPVFLEDTDSLFIPKRPSHVSIIGAVGKETVGIYKTNKSVKNYFAEAGGLGREANLKASFILLPNGQSEPLRKDVIVPPGSVIVVMPKTDRLSALGLSSVISRIMGNIATSILAINNVR